MKPAIKKLKTCTYSKDLVSSPIFGQREQHTNKLVCDHPEMKVNWTEKVCGPCTVYENRNAELVVPAPQPPPPPVQQSPAKAASSAPVNPGPRVPSESQPVAPSPAVPLPAESPKAPRKRTEKPVESPPAPVNAPAKSTAKVRVAKKKAKSPDAILKSSGKPKAKPTKEQPHKSSKAPAAKPKRK